MPDDKLQAVVGTGLLFERAVTWTFKSWRSVATTLAMGFALLITWGVINGGHGLRIWQQKRAEDRQLQRQIEDLKQENARLQEHVERLKSDPNTIEQAARERLHYARPGEVIYALPPETQNLAPPAGAGK